jgi:hypothetical protein
MHQHISKTVMFVTACAMALMLATAPLSARAQEAADTAGGGNASAAASTDAKFGSITVEFLDADGKKVTTKDGGSIVLYRVAALDLSSGSPRFDFTMGDFAKTTTVHEIASLPEQELMNQSERISASLMSEIAQGGYQPFASATIESSEARFALVPEGLYLVCQRTMAIGDAEMAPFMATVPEEDGSYEVIAWPKPITEPRPSVDPNKNGNKDRDKDDDKIEDRNGGEEGPSTSPSTSTGSPSTPSATNDTIRTSANGNPTVGTSSGTRGVQPATGDASIPWAPALLCGLAGIGAGAHLLRIHDES